MVKQLNGEDISTISPTLGFNITSLVLSRRGVAAHRAPASLPAPRRYTLNVWDVGGQKTLRAYWRNYYESTDGLVWVLDASDSARLGDVRAELHALLGEEKARACAHVFSGLLAGGGLTPAPSARWRLPSGVGQQAGHRGRAERGLSARGAGAGGAAARRAARAPRPRLRRHR